MMLTAALVLFLFSVCGAALDGAALTHVVMPFHPKQLDMAFDNLAGWSRFRPCLKPANVQFVFFLSVEPDQELKAQAVSAFASLQEPIRSCFAGVSVAFASLGSNDTYLRGSRMMFEQMLLKEGIISGPVSHVLYMEPDCRPVRQYWLDRLRQDIEESTMHFWVKGSIFRGLPAVMQTKTVANRLHINGNAIYNVGDEAFVHFYFDQVRPYISEYYNEGAYDTDIYKFLLRDQAKPGARYLHLFQYTELIQNMWHSPYSLHRVLEGSPDTVLVHGGEAGP